MTHLVARRGKCCRAYQSEEAPLPILNDRSRNNLHKIIKYLIPWAKTGRIHTKTIYCNSYHIISANAPSMTYLASKPERMPHPGYTDLLSPPQVRSDSRRYTPCRPALPTTVLQKRQRVGFRGRTFRARQISALLTTWCALGMEFER